jgi:hypothetical protein
MPFMLICILLSTLVIDREVLLRLCVLRGAEMITPKHGRLDSVTAKLIYGAWGLWISLGRWAGYTLSKHHWRSKRYPPVTARALRGARSLKGSPRARPLLLSESPVHKPGH